MVYEDFFLSIITLKRLIKKSKMRKLIITFILVCAFLTLSLKIQPSTALPPVWAAIRRGFLEGISEEPKMLAVILRELSDSAAQALYDAADKDIQHFSLLLPRAQACFFGGLMATLYVFDILSRRISDDRLFVVTTAILKYARLFALAALTSAALVSLGDEGSPTGTII